MPRGRNTIPSPYVQVFGEEVGERFILSGDISAAAHMTERARDLKSSNGNFCIGSKLFDKIADAVESACDGYGKLCEYKIEDAIYIANPLSDIANPLSDRTCFAALLSGPKLPRDKKLWKGDSGRTGILSNPRAKPLNQDDLSILEVRNESARAPL